MMEMEILLLGGWSGYEYDSSLWLMVQPEFSNFSYQWRGNSGSCRDVDVIDKELMKTFYIRKPRKNN